MASGSGSPSPLRPLSIGNVVSTAIRLYGAHLKQYLGISAIATLWGLLPFGVAILLIGMIVAGVSTNSVGLIVLGAFLWLPWIALLIFCMPQILVNSALISRLAYQELIEKPESLLDARTTLRPKKWMFFLVFFLMGLLLAGIQMGLTMVFQYIPMFIGLAITASSRSEATGVGWIAMIISQLGSLVVLVIYYWFYARWFIPDAILAAEPNADLEVIGRSWTLSKDSALRILLIIFVGGLITSPFFLVAIVPLIIVIFANIAFFASQAPPAPSDLQSFFLSFGSGLVFSLLLLYGVNILLLPFWQSIKAVIYCDLRSRREGLGLKLRDRKEG
jgi:hypothetical protein